MTIETSDPGITEGRCLLAHRTLEITDGVLEGDQSTTWTQTENNLFRPVELLDFFLGGA